MTNMTPTKAAVGIKLMTGYATRIMRSMNIEALTADSLVVPPLWMFMIDWPMVVQPPMAPKMPLMMLPVP